MRNTQKNAIIKLLKRRYVSVWDAYEMVGCTKLPARVSELIQQGYQIDKKEMNVTTRFGAKVRIKKYRIIGVPKDETKNLQNLQK